MRLRALFLDRDGTLVHPRHYPSRPEELCLYAGIAAQLRRFQQASFLLVLITNQAGVARGYFTEEDLQHMHAHLTGELGQSGVTLDGIYYCPHHPAGVIPELAVACGCRKPEPGMLFTAAADLQIDLRRSWFVGDILNDVEAGNRAGCRTVLVDLGTEALPEHARRAPDFVGRDANHALDIIAAVERLGPLVERDYRPLTWQLAEQTQMQLHLGAET
jgi:D-glycero-D-manno-heptose 1,7-bisphosphate phosphatase